ncbi:hypothetical protein J1N35_007979 [Gossypium stocksii]|uniref:Uncharacterized protein n=1 Tax=Gossypium stocksii TaxID=47602 RepID=A0A9D4AG64_9ROSI|nr:hypothetical protein J1N35_007979 [Gossypium stocksii]
MGNCMEASKRQMKEEEEEIEKENSTGKTRVKVKIVLTKEELELFVVKLKKNHGRGKRLGDILEEIKKARCGNKHHSWRPSLESIKED